MWPLWCLILCLPAAAAIISVPLSKEPEVVFSPTDAVGRWNDKQLVDSNLARRPALAYATVYIGTPPQVLDLQIDTGSSDFVIPGGRCKYCGVPKPFRCNESTTCHPVLCGAHPPYRICKFAMTYGSGGHVEGDVVSDQFMLSVERGSLVSSIYIDLINTCRPRGFFKAHYYNGIFGLGPSQGTGSTFPSPLRMLLEEQHLPNIFAIYTGSTIKHVAGVLTLGGYDKKAYVGEIQYTPMVSKGCSLWEYCAEPLGITIGGVLVTPKPKEFGVTLIDSGTTLTLLPHVVMRRIRQHFQMHYCHLPLVCKPKGATLFDGKCIKGDTLPSGFPTMEWRWRDNVVVKVPPEAYFIKRKNCAHCTQFCFGLDGVDSTPGDPASTLGDTFMAAAYIIFDRENQRLGFASPDWVPFAAWDPAQTWRQALIAFGFSSAVFLVAAVMLYYGLTRDPPLPTIVGPPSRATYGACGGGVDKGVGSFTVTHTKSFGIGSDTCIS